MEQDNYILTDGQHEAIIAEDVWQAAQVKLIAQAKRYEHVNRGKDTKTHLLSGIVRCPVCGAGMYGNKSIKRKKDGTKYQCHLDKDDAKNSVCRNMYPVLFLYNFINHLTG